MLGGGDSFGEATGKGPVYTATAILASDCQTLLLRALQSGVALQRAHLEHCET